MVFNERLRQLRQGKGITQTQAAQGIGITNRNYQRLEADGSIPSYQSLLAIADFFDVSVDYLMGRTDQKEINR